MIKEPSEQSSQKNLWNHFQEYHLCVVYVGAEVLFPAADPGVACLPGSLFF